MNPNHLRKKHKDESSTSGQPSRSSFRYLSSSEGSPPRASITIMSASTANPRVDIDRGYSYDSRVRTDSRTGRTYSVPAPLHPSTIAYLTRERSPSSSTTMPQQQQQQPQVTAPFLVLEPAQPRADSMGAVTARFQPLGTPVAAGEIGPPSHEIPPAVVRTSHPTSISGSFRATSAGLTPSPESSSISFASPATLPLPPSSPSFRTEDLSTLNAAPSSEEKDEPSVHSTPLNFPSTQNAVPHPLEPALIVQEGSLSAFFSPAAANAPLPASELVVERTIERPLPEREQVVPRMSANELGQPLELGPSVPPPAESLPSETEQRTQPRSQSSRPVPILPPRRSGEESAAPYRELPLHVQFFNVTFAGIYLVYFSLHPSHSPSLCACACALVYRSVLTNTVARQPSDVCAVLDVGRPLGVAARSGNSSAANSVHQGVGSGCSRTAQGRKAYTRRETACDAASTSCAHQKGVSHALRVAPKTHCSLYCTFKVLVSVSKQYSTF